MAEISGHLLRKSFDRRTRREPISCYGELPDEWLCPERGATQDEFQEMDE